MNLTKKPLLLAVFATVSLLFLTSNPSPARAAENFDPDYIISDAEMQASDSMNRADIEAFLIEQGGYISTYKTTDAYGVRRTTSDIIYRAALEYSINPKYLLVKLQKEQSLITDQDPTQKQLDWATGYGVCDGCSTSDSSIQKYKGFGLQVDAAAGIMRYYYDNYATENWIKRPDTTYTIDSLQVTPANYATAFLYTYTPHILGNQNFWTLWNMWFAQVYPNGSLVKCVDNDNVYLIADGKKRFIKNMAVLVTRFDPKLIIDVSESELASYEAGPDIALPNWSIVHNTDTDKYYLLDNDYIREFESHDVVRAFGYHPDEIIEVTSADLQFYEKGAQITFNTSAPNGRLLKITETGQTYYLKDNLFYPLYDLQIATINFPNLPVETGVIVDLEGLERGEPILFKDGTLFGINGSSKIYVVEDGKKRHIASEEVYESIGYKWENIVWTNEFAGLAHPTGQPVYVQQSNSNATTAANTGDTSVMHRSPTTDFYGPQFETNMDTYLVADYESGEILAGKNTKYTRPLASLTKVLAAYELIQDGLDLSKIVTYSSANHKSIYHRYRIAEGEKVRNRNLLDALLVSSLNTPVYMLIDSLDKDWKKFAAEMTARANEWNADTVEIYDPAGTGVDNVGNAEDYLIIFTQALENDIVYDYLAKTSYIYDEVYDIDGNPKHFDYHSNDIMHETDNSFTVLTSKTGYLDEAGSNLAMLVERNSDAKRFIIITMGNPDYNHKFNDPRDLTNWAMSEF